MTLEDRRHSDEDRIDPTADVTTTLRRRRVPFSLDSGLSPGRSVPRLGRNPPMRSCTNALRATSPRTRRAPGSSHRSTASRTRKMARSGSGSIRTSTSRRSPRSEIRSEPKVTVNRSASTDALASSGTNNPHLHQIPPSSSRGPAGRRARAEPEAAADPVAEGGSRGEAIPTPPPTSSEPIVMTRTNVV